MLSVWSKMKKLFRFKNSPRRNEPRVPNQMVSSGSVSGSPNGDLGGCSSMISCGICLGQGQAMLTAECSHSFHFSCLENYVQHGNVMCPICCFEWSNTRFRMPILNASGRTITSSAEPVRFSDDEPLVIISCSPTTPCEEAPSAIPSVHAYTQYPAVASQESIPDFAVLVRVQAPPLRAEDWSAPIDLVLVLDVSMSMYGAKLELLKHAACFIVDQLGCNDRLSVVSFASEANRILPLCRMTDRGRRKASAAIHSLEAHEGTNIAEGLKKGQRVLGERRESNPVGSLILLSDGNETCDRGWIFQTEFLKSLTTFPVHTFGFGCHHESYTMHAIADVSGGTYSFIEYLNMVQDAFARCLAGLLTVVAQEFRLSVATASPGVQIGSISSSPYASAISMLGQEGVISIGDLYADEEKEFLISLYVPAECSPEVAKAKTKLLHIVCSYQDASGTTVHFEGGDIEILRPVNLSSTDQILSIEVDRQMNRLLVLESIEEAQGIAETGDFAGAKEVLSNRRTLLLASASAQAGDGLCGWFEGELREIESRMENMEMFERIGRSYALSGLSSISQQRATTRGDSLVGSGPGESVGYDTPSVMTMISKSQQAASAMTLPE